jgi:hypothetical protein
MAKSNPIFRGGRHRGKEPPFSRAELHHFENSLVVASNLCQV